MVFTASCMRKCALVLASLTLGVAVAGQGQGGGHGGGGGGGNGGGASGLLSPVLITYANVIGVHPPLDVTHYYLNGSARNQHPEQLTPGGKSRQQIHSVSPYGDLTHGGGARWVLDVRLDVSPAGFAQVNALIATPETAASESNPTWYYLPAEDDGVDVVLLDTSVYEVHAARWATSTAGGKLKVAFFGTGPWGGSTVDGLWVGQVTWSSGPASGLDDITLIAEGAEQANWGTANQLVFAQPDGAGGLQLFVADVSGIPAVSPAIAFTGIQGGVTAPALSHDAMRIAFVQKNSNGASIEIRIVDLGTGQTITLNTGNNLPVKTPEWSPDDTEIAFVGGSIGLDGALYKANSSGAGGSKKLTQTKLVNGVLTEIVVGPVIWRE